MAKIMISIPFAGKYKSHILDRFEDAKKDLLVNENSSVLGDELILFLPKDINLTDVNQANINTSLLSITQSDTSDGWVRRPDAAEEAAKWLANNFRLATLVGGAGFAQIGDASLSNKSYVCHNGKPLFYTSVGSADIENLEKVLRGGNPLEIIGVVSTGIVNSDSYQIPFQGYFLTGIYDGDALVLAKFDKVL